MAVALTKKICDILIKKKFVSEKELDKARKICAEKGGSLSDILVDMGAVSKEELLALLIEELGFPPVKLSCLKVEDDVINLIPKKVAAAYQILPISRVGGQLTVAMVDPLNIFAIDDLKLVTNLVISPVISSEEDMKEAFQKYYEKSADEKLEKIVGDIESTRMEVVHETEEAVFLGDILKIVEDAPVVKMTNAILSSAVKEHASDILIEPMEGSSRVRYRIDGVLREQYNPPKKFHQALISRLKVMSNLDIAERRLPQDGRFRIKADSRKVDFRISVVPSSYGEKAALRILDKESASLNIDKLGFKERDIQTFKMSGARPHGMILVCGPTGCGKTTTLYSILKHVDAPEKNIVTVEDPVEYELEGINQVSVNENIGLTFAACLRSILRQDPNVIMVGEIRDFDTLDVAVKSALTGHLVLSTLHTNTASGSVIRMVNMGIEPFLITSSVELVAAQRLLRRLCPECKEAYTPTKEVAEKYNLFDKKKKMLQIFKPVGCKRCAYTGYHGRIGIVECMKMTPAVKSLIFKKAEEFEIEKMAIKEGMFTLRENGIENVLEGIASLEDVLCLTVEARKIK